MTDNRSFSPSAARNRDPILEILRGVLPPKGLVLEIASGTGEHVHHFATHLPTLIFLPSDPDVNARNSILSWSEFNGAKNVMAPLALDVTKQPWPLSVADAVICINMIYISPWEATEGLFEGASVIMPPYAPLYLYGPYKRSGVHTAPSNAEFDASLRTRDAAWGVRDLEAVTDCATKNGFGAPEIIEMPANNLSLIFRRGA